MLLHGFKTTLLLDPPKGEHGDVNGVNGGRVETGFLGDVCLVIQHRGDLPTGLAEEVLANDDERDARGAEVLLSPGVDDAEALQGEAAAEDIGGHIGHEGRVGSGEVLKLGTEDGIVARQVDVAKTRGNLDVLGDVVVVLVLGTGQDLYPTEHLSLLDGLGGPGTGIDVARRLVFPQ